MIEIRFLVVFLSFFLEDYFPWCSVDELLAVGR